MTGTTILQGSFTSTGVNTTISVPSGASWVRVLNTTALAAQTNNASYEWVVQDVGTGLAAAVGRELRANAGSTAVNMLASTGSILSINTATALPGAPVALTAISAATPPLVSTGSTTGLSSNNGVVEIINVVGAQQFGGMTFSIGTVVANTSFTLKYAPTIIAGTTGFYRIIPNDPIFYPRRRYITAITTGATTQIKMSVDTTYTVGQLVRIVVPAAFGSISQNINGLSATVLSINTTTNVVTVDLNSTGMGTFVFPLTAAVPFTQAQLAPIGSGAPDTGETSNTLLDATENRAVSGIQLLGGTMNLPAGLNGDVIYWQAGTSFNLP